MITRYEGSNRIADITTSKPTDTGWVDIPWSSSFKNYQDVASNRLQARKINGIVEIIGVAAPTADLPYSIQGTVMATLPEQFVPDKAVYCVQQGSGIARWAMTVSPNGNITFGRYGNESGGVTCTTANWLPFSVTYLVGDK